MWLFFDKDGYLHEFWFYLGVGLLVYGIPIILIIGGIWTLFCIHWSVGEQIYTGYIYSVDDGLGNSTNGHLRFSKYAGKDEQPSFCVEKANGQQIKELAGSDKKVRVTIPAGFALAAPWDCPIPARVEVVDE